MDETEAKILDVYRSRIVPKLLELGAKQTFDGDVHAIFFDFPDRSVRGRRDTIRLRTVGDKAYLTTKRPIKHATLKVREENEVEVSDFRIARKCLEAMGLSVWKEMRKHRTSFRLGKVAFELDKHIDEYSFVPEFLEIEGTEEEVYSYAAKLGFSKEDLRPWTILDIAENMKKK